jgi:integrase
VQRLLTGQYSGHSTGTGHPGGSSLTGGCGAGREKLAERAGLDPAKYAGHSLRAGHATAAAIAGASERSIMAQTGHRSVQMVRRYIRDGSLLRGNSAGKLGL